MDQFPGTSGDQVRSPVYADGGVHVDGGNQQVDRLLDALGTYRRRCVLYHLMETESAELEEVVDGVAAMETGQSPDAVPADVRETVKADLYHNTLPKLAELNVVEYDQRTKTVRYQHPPPHIEKFLDLTRDLDPV